MHKRELTIGQDVLSIETGKLAKQANGSVIVRYGDTVVLVTACYAAAAREGIDFLPLTVDYREYTYASGRIPGGFFKREGKPTEKEVLTSRVIDRPIRPLFPSGWHHETQIIALVLSADTDNDSDVLAITGASAALALSEIPFEKTIAGVRVGARRRRVRHQPDLRAAQASRPRPRRRRQPGRPRDGRGGREGGHRGAGRRRRSRPAHAAIKQIVDADRRDGAGGRQDEGRRRRRRRSATTSTARSRRRCCVPLSEAMRIQDKLENYERGRPGARGPRGVAPRGGGRARGSRPRRSSRNSRRRCCATRSSSAACGSTAASSTRSARSGSRSACCRARTARPSSRAARRRRS